MENKVAYRVYLYTGDYPEEYREYTEFITLDQEVADAWCKKFNRIVSSYIDFIQSKHEDTEDLWEESLIWFDRLSEFDYKATFERSKVR